MKIEYRLDSKTLDKFKKGLQDKLEVAATKGWETMVERTPARSETQYSTGQLRQSLRFQKVGDFEYEFYCPVSYGLFVEFGTGPRGKATGAVPEFPDDPQPRIHYHSGEVLVTRWRGVFLDEPKVRHTQGMEAQPFMRPGLLTAVEVLKELLK